MARGFIKLNGMYVIWSTVVDAPITRPMDRDQALKEALFHGWWSREDAEQSLRRADDRGVSFAGFDNLDDLLVANRAGPGETCLTKDELIAVFWPASEQ